MDEIVAVHRRLVGPADGIDAIAAVQEVVQVDRADRQASLLVRRTGPVFDPRWVSHPVDLEQIVLAYLAQAANRAAIETSAPKQVAA